MTGAAIALLVAWNVTTTLLALMVLVRQVTVTLLFHFGRRGTSGLLVSDKSLPKVTVIVPAHNEERVLYGCLECLTRMDYPSDRYEIIVINDRSRDGTGAIADDFAARHPFVRVIHRPKDAAPGKPAALLDAINGSTSEILVFFDADYLPPPQIIRRLVAPFADPLVGATMGRVVPYNANANMLTKLLDLERRGGYVVDQEVRHRMSLLPQFGGTTGAVRRSALEAVGGWNTISLAEDTDLTYRLFIAGMRVAYVAGAECYEESPETWQVRYRQVKRWAIGHNDCLGRYFFATLRATRQPLMARLDAALVLLVYTVPSLVLLNLVIALAMPTQLGETWASLSIMTVSLTLFTGIGNFAPFYQIAAGCVSDGQRRAFSAVPFLFVSSFTSLLACNVGVLQLLKDKLFGITTQWDKTQRFRGSA
ncbi:glycosyltransferase family 2 protein [Rhodobacter sp. SY28-1]|uniref:glycosyltransferase n=1 Tax=Rhodobacter sp. SY28-1 TaxID=2562317 RepID=UPI00197FBCE2|nr:glycosyltransferase [Rhodobacter sp. SY28-1]